MLPHPTPSFALDESAATSNDLAKYNLPPNYVFYPAQFWTHKNHAAIVEAVAHLKRTDNLRFPVVFTGSDQGNERAVRELVEKMQMQDQVFFLGHVSRETLKALYQNALALCYVSFFGPENMPPLEAFGLGCPVIAADVPGASEQLGDAAIRVNPSDELAIEKNSPGWCNVRVVLPFCSDAATYGVGTRPASATAAAFERFTESKSRRHSTAARSKD